MTDRRRINGPPSGTSPPVFASSLSSKVFPAKRKRAPDELRKICRSCKTIFYLQLAVLWPIPCTDVHITFSPQDRLDAISVWFRISRTRTIHTHCSAQITCHESTCSQTHMHGPWPPPSSPICALFASTFTLHPYQICTFRGSTTERLRSRRWRTRSCRSP